MDVIGRVGFGFDFECQKNPGKSTAAKDWHLIFETSERFDQYLPYKLMGVDLYKKIIPSGREYVAAVNRIKKVVNQVIANRFESSSQKEQKKGTDLLQLLMDSSRLEENKEEKEFGEDELTCEVMLFFLAGHETTANLLSWTLYYLSQHPKVLARIREELKETGAPSATDETPPSWGVVNNLPYMTQVLKETLRLHPALAGLGRETIKEEEYKGITIPSRTTLVIHSFSIHRDARHWKEPVEEFDPERFSPENSKGRHPMAWAPFGAGLRNCLGMQFAMIESRTVLSYLLPRYEVEATTKPKIVEKGVLTSENMRLRFKPI